MIQCITKRLKLIAKNDIGKISWTSPSSLCHHHFLMEYHSMGKMKGNVKHHIGSLNRYFEETFSLNGNWRIYEESFNTMQWMGFNFMFIALPGQIWKMHCWLFDRDPSWSRPTIPSRLTTTSRNWPKEGCINFCSIQRTLLNSSDQKRHCLSS